MGGSSAKNFVMLDQWRGIALILVLINHGFHHTGWVHGLGRMGVNLFFFISGLLVYRSLIKLDHLPSKKLWLIFVKKRFRRLVPALAAFLLLVSLVYLYQFGEFPFRQVGISATWLSCYFGTGNPTGHLWSISVEMQFYFLSPVLYVFFRRKKISEHQKLFGMLLILGIACAFGIYGLMNYHGGNVNKYSFHVAVWPMLIGYFCEMYKDGLKKKLKYVFKFINTTMILTLIAWVLAVLLKMKDLSILIGVSMMPLCYLMYLNNQSFSGKLSKLVEWIGKRTYSIYLWQQPLTLDAAYSTIWRPFGALLSIAIGAISFKYFEKGVMVRKNNGKIQS